MLYFKATVIAILCVGSSARELRASASRSLLEDIANYKPTTLVTDENAIDQDQKAMEALMGPATDPAFAQGLKVYSEGGNTGSYAKLTLSAPITTNPLPKAGDPVTGLTGATPALPVKGKVLENYASGTSISVVYDVSEAQITHSTCRVGGLDFTLIAGCLAPTGNIKINNGADIAYTYTVASDNRNSITLRSLSTGSAAQQTDSTGKLYPTFQKYVDYYGDAAYADKMVTAAFEGKSVLLKSAQFDFTAHPLRARDQAIKKTTAYTTLNMVVFGHLERAIEMCVAGKEALSSLDKAVAFYTGSQEGIDGLGNGFTLMNHADRRCGGYRTCGDKLDQVNGTSKVNLVMAEVFNSMKTSLTAKNCPAAKTKATSGMATMLIPQIQGAMRYTRVLATRTNYTGHETAEAEGAAFAAGVLPPIASCNAASAKTIWDNLRYKAAKAPNGAAVKAAFESVFKCLGISCVDVGGQWNGTQYIDGWGPCTDAVPTTPVATPGSPPTPKAPSAATPVATAPAAAPTKEEKVGFFKRILRRIRKFFGGLF